MAIESELLEPSIISGWMELVRAHRSNEREDRDRGKVIRTGRESDCASNAPWLHTAKRTPGPHSRTAEL